MGANEEMESSYRAMVLDFGAFVDLVDEQIATLCRGAALDLFRELVKGTPVDTGWARANWIPTLNTPDEKARPKPPGDRTYGKPADGVLLAGIAGNTVNDIIWLTNAVPYIVSLADGHSQKAPNGWVELAIERIAAKLNSLDLERRQ